MEVLVTDHSFWSNITYQGDNYFIKTYSEINKNILKKINKQTNKSLFRSANIYIFKMRYQSGLLTDYSFVQTSHTTITTIL